MSARSLKRIGSGRFTVAFACGLLLSAPAFAGQQTKTSPELGTSTEGAASEEDSPTKNPGEAPSPQVGDLLTRIRCVEDYEARVFAVGLQAPDGLTFDAKGQLVVVEETAGQVTRIGPGGQHFALATGLRSPEGIARDLSGAGGDFVVVEDLLAGRLASIKTKLGIAKKAPANESVTQASVTFHDFAFDACEGVLIHGDTLYLTDSNAQLVENPFSARTRLFALPREKEGWGKPQVILERNFPFSFSELIADGKHHLILVNESACSLVRDGLLRFDLRSGDLTSFTTGLVSPEGICQTPFDPAARDHQGGFPLLIAEENYDGEGHGRLSRVDAQGNRTTFAIGFETLEDVLVAADGRIFVSEDATGLMIELRPRALQ